jgi:beta-lactamase superfamily II metal-dependent hydrolase
MLNFRAVQAAFGDSLIIEFGTVSQPQYVLIDGGPARVYKNDLEAVLKSIKAAGHDLDLVVLSHVDNDHVIGLLDYFSELEQEVANGTVTLPRVKGLWHNSFSDTIGKGNDIQMQLQTAIGSAAASMTDASKGFLAIGEGRQLRIRASQLAVPLNLPVQGKTMTVDAASAPVHIGNLMLRVVGPTEASLEALRKEWVKWLNKHKDKIKTDPQVAKMADKSIPNLSSIVLWAEADGKTLLLTGDARGDFVIEGLEDAGIKKKGKPLAMDLLKLPHHGSDRNVDQAFFQTLTANTYVVSADGTYDNPDLDTLGWIATAAKQRAEAVTIWATNETPATKEFQKKFKPSAYSYTLKFRDPAKHSLDVTVSP